MSPRQRKIDFDPLTRFRNMSEAHGRPGMAGLSRVGAGLGGDFGAVQQSVLPSTRTSATGHAQLLVLSTTGDSIASGGDYVAFDTAVDKRAFIGFAPPSSGYWTHPITATYLLIYEHEWVIYEGGGTIELELDGTVVGTITTGSVGAHSFDVVEYYAEAGQEGRIKVTHDDASAQTCDATLQVVVSDPDGAHVPESWRHVTSADVYDLTWDGSSWWTTEGTSGVTVSQRGIDWDEDSSFEATAVGTSLARVRGITADATSLWVVGADNDSVANYSTAGALLSEFDPAWTDEVGLTGVAFDGTDLWVVGNTTDQLRRYTTAGVLQQTATLPSTDEHAGCAYYNGRIYVVNTTASTLVPYRIATDAFEDPIDVSAAVPNPTGVYIDDEGTLYISKDGAGVWRRNTLVN